MAEDGKKHWIKNAIKHPGAMTEAAKREGVSNSSYIEEHKHDSGKAGKRARLAETLKGMHHQHHQASTPPSKIRNSFYGKKG